MRIPSIAIAFTIVAGCSSDDAGPPAAAPDSGVTPEGGGPTDSGANDGAPVDTPYSLAVVGDKPLLYWRFDDSAGPAARDRSTNMLNGTYSATGVTFGQPSLVGDGNPSVRISAGGSVDGPKDARLAFVGTASFTVECWVSFAQPPTEIHTILARASDAPATGYSMWLDPAGSGVRAYFGRYVGGSGVTVATAEATPLVAGTAYHVVGVYDGTRLSIYLDGAVGAQTDSNVAMTDGGYQIRIGRSDTTTTATLAALVDELAVYGAVLPKDRIDAHLALRSR